ncbi:MAG: HAMP domain-containing sensor histidine kinase [Bacteroidia bacterium]|nr:HAMP domain-containing sensor histidine kinase [Bacteroidia bacterium]
MKNSTNASSSFYQRLSILAFLLLILLILIQISWLSRAVNLQREQTHARLQKLIPDIALDINRIDHSLFHDTLLDLTGLDLLEVEYRIDKILEENDIDQDIHFAFYQETPDGIFLSNMPAKQADLVDSDIRSCMSCIVSFSVVKDTNGLGSLEEEEYREQLFDRSEFQYYSPINSLKSAEDDVLWLALYAPHEFSAAIKSLIYIFLLSLLLLLCLLGLFFYVLRSLSRHKKLSQVKNDFFNNVSHEFKTPLSSIRLASKVLQQSKDPEKNKTYHQLIEKESLLLEQQIDKLLEFSLLDNKELEFEYQEIDLNQLIREIPARLKVLIEEKKAHLKVNLDESLAFVKGDATHLSNSFCNLVENSLKYSQQGVEVEISTLQDGKQVFIRVKDNGPGIKDEYQDQIFDRFFRAQNNNQYKGQGFGIGLSYVKSIIEAHKGNIRLNKAYKEGCEFIIKL